MAAQPASGLRTYVVGLYRPGPNRPQIPTEDRPQLLRGHLEFLQKLRESGELIVYGPSEDDTIVGLVVFATDSVDRARALIALDPKLVQGDLVLDLMEWHAAPGLTLP